MDAPLPPLVHARAVVERALASAIFRSPRLVAFLARRRAAPVDGRRLDPQTAALLALDDLENGSDMTRLSPAEARLRMARQIPVVDAPPPPGVRTEDHRFRASGTTLHARLYTPAGLAAPSPAILYLHGGGWVVGSIATHDGLCRRLAIGARCRVLSLDYRLAPEHRFPTAVEDAVGAFRWLAAHADALGADPARLALAGDSAGGNLSAVAALHTRSDTRPPVLQVLLYPGIDATCSAPSHRSLGEGYFLSQRMIDWYLGHYLHGGDPRQPDMSPIFAADLRGVAPALVYTAGFDPLRDEGQAYAERLREAGALVAHREYAGLVHGFAMMTGLLDAARRALDEIGADVGRELRERRPGSAA